MNKDRIESQLVLMKSEVKMIRKLKLYKIENNDII